MVKNENISFRKNVPVVKYMAPILKEKSAPTIELCTKYFMPASSAEKRCVLYATNTTKLKLTPSIAKNISNKLVEVNKNTAQIV